MPPRPLERVLSALQEGNEEEARAALADAWRARRAPRLAELASLLEARRRSALGAQIAEIVAPRVALTLERLAKLSDLDDPLLATFVLDSLESPPFTGPSSRPLLEALLDAAARLEDPRIVERAPAIAKVWELRVTPKPSRVALTKQLDRIVAATSKSPPRTADANELALEAALAESLRLVTASHRTGADLFADVYANPTDDAPRLVLADFLLERGDPRGELIALQFKRREGGLDERGAAREYALLKKHGKEWLGPLAPVISWGKGYARSRFERGFLAVADIILSVGKKMDLVLGEPSWAVVEELEGSWPTELLEHAPLRGLRRMKRLLVAETIEKLAAKGIVFPSLEELRIHGPETNLRVLFQICPALRILEVDPGDSPTMAGIAELLQLPLHRLVIDRRWAGEGAEVRAPRLEAELAALLAELATVPVTVPELAIQPPWFRSPKPPPIELRADGGRYRRV